jgi:hypothetical protein
MSDVIGPLYNYANHIIDPVRLKVSGKGNMKYLWKDLGALSSHVDTLTFGSNAVSSVFGAPSQRPLGNKYFIKSGTCSDDDSTEECKGKDKYIYINNVPTGKVPCLGQLGIDLPAIAPFKGLVPGLIEDVASINPFAIFNSLLGKGGISRKCSMRTEDVGYEGNYTSVSKCSPPTPPIQCLPQISENFTNIQNNKIENNCKKKYIFFLAFILTIILIFFFSHKK